MQQAAVSSSLVIFLQSTRSTVAKAWPLIDDLGDLLAHRRSGPRYVVCHVLVSMVFIPCRIILANGSFMDIAFIL